MTPNEAAVPSLSNFNIKGERNPLEERMNRLQKKTEKAQKQCDDWNDKYKYPMEVILTDDQGVEHQTRTRSIAWEICGHASILVEGRSGGYLLDRIRPV